MGLFPCKLEPDIWMPQNGNIYEYIDMYVDDLEIVPRNPKSLVYALYSIYEFNTNETRPIEFILDMISSVE